MQAARGGSMSTGEEHPDRPAMVECLYGELAAALRRIEEAGGHVLRMDVRAGTYTLAVSWPKPRQPDLFEEEPKTHDPDPA